MTFAEECKILSKNSLDKMYVERMNKAKTLYIELKEQIKQRAQNGYCSYTFEIKEDICEELRWILRDEGFYVFIISTRNMNNYVGAEITIGWGDLCDAREYRKNT